MQKENELWEKHGRSSMKWYEWHALCSSVDHLWEEAEAASQAAGVAYVGRGGVRKLVPPEDTSLVGRALALYASWKELSSVSQ